MTPLEFCPDFWNQQTRIPGLLYSVICVILGVAHRLVTNGQTHGHTMTYITCLNCIILH